MALKRREATAGAGSAHPNTARPDSARPDSARRELTLAVLLAAAAGASGLVAGSRTWLDLQVDREPPLPPVAQAVSGATAAPLVPGLALVVLAAAVGLLATRRWGRAATGWIIVLAGAGILVAAQPWVGDVSQARAEAVAFDVGLPAGAALHVSSSSGAWIAVLAGSLAVVLGVATVLRSPRWPVMGARYDAPPSGQQGTDHAGAVPAQEKPTDRETWDAIDRGEDPTGANHG